MDEETHRIGSNCRLTQRVNASAVSPPFHLCASVRLSIKVCVARADFPERGSATRSSITWRPVSGSNRRVLCHRSAAAHRAALLWLRLRRAVSIRGLNCCSQVE